MYFVHVYIFKTKKKKKKKIQDFQNFPKKREKFSKKKIFGLGTLDFLVTFSKKAHFFFFQRFQDSLKSPFQNGT